MQQIQYDVSRGTKISRITGLLHNKQQFVYMITFNSASLAIIMYSKAYALIKWSNFIESLTFKNMFINVWTVLLLLEPLTDSFSNCLQENEKKVENWSLLATIIEEKGRSSVNISSF